MQREGGEAGADGQLVEVQSDFHREARKPGGVPRSAAVKQAGKVIDHSGADLLERMDMAFDLIQLEADTQMESGFTSERLIGLRTEVRVMRDLGALAGYPVVTAVCALFSDYLSEALGKQSKPRGDVLAVYLDVVRLMFSPERRGLTLLEVPDLLPQLHEMQSRILPAS